MSTHTEITHSHDGEAGVAHGSAIYVKTLLALLFLTGITIGASYIDLGSGNVVVALIIATIKASLVVLFFMHLRWDKPVYGIVAMAGFLFLGIFLMFDLMDQETRNYYLPQNLHRTEVPLTPGTAPAAMTEILPDTSATGAAAAPAPAAGEKAPEGDKK
ncbi:MAG TPA: cytochrome C oxidase subunit IV family protein [Bryobacteraceae bacterium]|jgi:cytochrome c oxidase subunit 4